jgi:hypothetical protein
VQAFFLIDQHQEHQFSYSNFLGLDYLKRFEFDLI